ncbi:MAG TPA: peptide ABC transporter substrate-binding protein [Chloroflexi bacterium]|nr:peptide ABC transporter substrate-binding protein [Chloroflexota bacterium]
MLHQFKWTCLLFMVTLWLLAGCSQIITVTVTSPPETVVVTATAAPSFIPMPTPPPEKALNICVVGEPDTLYLYGGSRRPATRHVMEALYDGPIDYVGYAYRPVILEKVPSIADGDALTRSVRVREGSVVLNAGGEVVTLTNGVRVLPSGCRTDECAVTFEEGSLQMERVEATFTLRDDVTWSDGELVTPEDSIFAFEVASDPKTPGRHYLVERTLRYRISGENQIQWVGAPGFIDSTYYLNFFAPLPRHQLEGREPEDLLRAMETRRDPLGWGPFVVDEWVAGDYIRLSRNPHYFRADEGLPKVEQVVFRFASGTPDVTARLLSGECDIGTHDANFELSMPLLIQAEQRGLLRMLSVPTTGWEHIDFGLETAFDYQRPDFFGNVNVRQAIIQCIDRQAIMDEVTYGRSVVPDSYLPPSHPLYAGVYLLHWGYNPEMGRALLEGAGWVDRNEDGVREAYRVPGVSPGTPFAINLLTSSDIPASQQVARIIKAYLADCGIRVNVDARPSWELFANGPEGPLFGRRFDMAKTAWWFGKIPLCGHYVSSEIPEPNQWLGANVSGYHNPEYDRVCQAALRALPGTPAYEEYHRQAQIIFSEELPAIPLFMWLRTAIIRPNVLNFTLDPASPSELWHIETLDIDLSVESGE